MVIVMHEWLVEFGKASHNWCLHQPKLYLNTNLYNLNNPNYHGHCHVEFGKASHNWCLPQPKRARKSAHHNLTQNSWLSQLEI